MAPIGELDDLLTSDEERERYRTTSPLHFDDGGPLQPREPTEKEKKFLHFISQRWRLWTGKALSFLEIATFMPLLYAEILGGLSTNSVLSIFFIFALLIYLVFFRCVGMSLLHVYMQGRSQESIRTNDPLSQINGPFSMHKYNGYRELIGNAFCSVPPHWRPFVLPWFKVHTIAYIFRLGVTVDRWWQTRKELAYPLVMHHSAWHKQGDSAGTNAPTPTLSVHEEMDLGLLDLLHYRPLRHFVTIFSATQVLWITVISAALALSGEPVVSAFLETTVARWVVLATLALTPLALYWGWTHAVALLGIYDHYERTQGIRPWSWWYRFKVYWELDDSITYTHRNAETGEEVDPMTSEPIHTDDS